MSLENAMESGYSPEREPEAEDIEEQEPEEKTYTCPRCNSDFTGDEPMYRWDDKYICGDCLEDAFHSMSASDLAYEMRLDESTAEEEA